MQNNAAAGAATGAVIGGILGGVMGGGRGAAIGAGSGMLFGGLSGAQADQQCQQMAAQIAYQQAAAQQAAIEQQIAQQAARPRDASVAIDREVRRTRRPSASSGSVLQRERPAIDRSGAADPDADRRLLLRHPLRAPVCAEGSPATSPSPFLHTRACPP